VSITCLALGQTALAAHVVPVVAGPIAKPKAAQLDFDAFFNKSVTIHVGDSVRWTIDGFHTVSFPARGQTQAPPFVLPIANAVVTGAVDAAGQPFFFNGQPLPLINPQVAFPSGGSSYDGSTFTNSGLPVGPSAGKPYTLKFPKAGIYEYFCLVHPGMTGVVKVLPKGKKVPTLIQDKLAIVAQYVKANKLAIKLAKIKPAPATVLAGNDKGGVAWQRFFPEKVTVKVGQPVKFEIASTYEQHTISFGPAAVLGNLQKNFVETTPNPTGPPTILNNPIAFYPSDPPGTLLSYDGANHGNGFANSGLLGIGEGLTSSAEIKFTKAGVYNYVCLVHAGMKGTITVTS
jgi:plastocyanin